MFEDDRSLRAILVSTSRRRSGFAKGLYYGVMTGAAIVGATVAWDDWSSGVSPLGVSAAGAGVDPAPAASSAGPSGPDAPARRPAQAPRPPTVPDGGFATAALQDGASGPPTRPLSSRARPAPGIAEDFAAAPPPVASAPATRALRRASNFEFERDR